jgi:hypothetical protein
MEIEWEIGIFSSLPAPQGIAVARWFDKDARFVEPDILCGQNV